MNHAATAMTARMIAMTKTVSMFEHVLHNLTRVAGSPRGLKRRTRLFSCRPDPVFARRRS